MANAGTSNSGKGLPIPYLTAAWAGMSPAEIEAGLKAGTIFAPPQGYVAASGVAASVASAPPDRARVEGWFTALDPTLSSDAFDSIWTHAGTDDAARSQALTSYLCKTLLPDWQSESAPEALDAYVADPAHRAHVVDLSIKTGTELAELAQGEVGYRYALANLQPVALTGNRGLYATVNADGRYDRFDPDTGETMISDAWLADRGKFLAWNAADDAGSDMVVSGSEDWTFIDRSSLDSNGDPLTMELKTGAADAGKNQVVFGSEDDEILKGVSGSDRMYGGGGDDVLRGGAGGDHLEGGEGDDLVMGGGGADELIGNQGADELEGGSGDDTLRGGSGEDLLTGGRGNDRLEGGAGNDTYAIEAGDGADTIVDADGLGAIELDGARIGGSMTAGEGKWLSADGRQEFTFDGDAQDGGTLTIESFSEGADHAGAADNTIAVKNWKNGDLGITLAGSPAAGNAQSTFEVSAITGPEVPVIAPVELPADSQGAASPASNSAAGEGALVSFDFDDALASLLGTGDPSFVALDPAKVQHAIEAFSGVLEPPDVSAAGIADDASFASAVTASDVADALASDASMDDLESESAIARMQVLPAPEFMKLSDEHASVAGSASNQAR